ncbi:enoyl-CoA hydratase [Mycobacterium florentinum]|uniref:Enoyl-CoA hydratase n=1 Tax=Mycobacterium florentinum TaxID=292462 RepID=A0A1X1UBW2_MYCFL|nr:enoyl-CoA hydratase-related protein [Mycobacterium florentinum]MCV7412342.1 enoyl-CoA hydratase/isomerase family protein [Mycobacterium florentinum]ORV54332.1 enoyl-CoA hydratase [Mycobacterium florentinum]BBX81722.1 enoyl-CoA hydratase [Mycobacterium florentinum]
MSSDSVLVENRGAVRIVTLNRPDKRNAIDIAVRLELASAIENAGQDASVRAIVLTGAGSAFCSGGDITSMERMSPERAMERTQLAQRVIRAIWNAGKPVVAAVEGSAFGAGVALAAACDRVVAASDARFATTFTNVGLAGDMGTFASLPSRVGAARARQMLMLPTPIDAPTALDMGLVDALVEPGTALTAALADAERLAAGPTRAYGVIKSMLAAGSALSPFELLDLEAEHQSQLFDSDDFAEGIAAFREKRRPQFGSAPP